MEVRAATAEDDSAIGELLVRAFVETYAKKLPSVTVTTRRKKELRDVASKRSVALVWVAVHDAVVVGTVSLWPPGATGSEAWLDNAADLRHLAVDPDWKGRGVSKALLDVAEAEARAFKATRVCLHVRRGAVGVRRLYESRNFVRSPEGDLDLLPEVFLEAFALHL